MKGIVKWFSKSKGYGFIAGEDGNDVFVHRDFIQEGDFLTEGDIVSYDVLETDRGLKASNVKFVDA